MRFASDEQRKAVMAKLNPDRCEARFGVRDPHVPRRALSTRSGKARWKGPAVNPEEWIEEAKQQIAAGDDMAAKKRWRFACFFYHQAVEGAAKGVNPDGYREEHNLANLLRKLHAGYGVSEDMVRDARKLNPYFYAAKPYRRETDIHGKEITRKEPPYDEKTAKEMRRIAVSIIDHLEAKLADLDLE